MKASPSRGRRIPKPWGYELVWAETDRYLGKWLHIEKGEALSYQYHRRKDETIFLLTGLLDLEVARAGGPRETLRLNPGDSFRIAPEVRHRMIAVETCDVFEVSTPEIDDVVRLEDRYGRAGTHRGP